MKKSNNTKEGKKKRDKDFAQLMKPEEIEVKPLRLKRPIYYNRRQYIVKIPKEIAMFMQYLGGDMIEYILTIPKK